MLAHAHAHPALTRNAGNIALLRRAGGLGLVPGRAGGAVADAYREYRRLQHQVRLTGARQARVDPDEWPHGGPRSRRCGEAVFGRARSSGAPRLRPVTAAWRGIG